MSPQPLDSVKGFAVTFRQLFKKPITQQYPEYKRPVYPRFRGRHRLHKHENGLEKCVGCSLCAAACPADCIRVVAEENTPENRVSPGERYARLPRRSHLHEGHAARGADQEDAGRGPRPLRHADPVLPGQLLVTVDP